LAVLYRVSMSGINLAVQQFTTTLLARSNSDKNKITSNYRD